MSTEVKLLGICGSLRKASRNMGLLRCAQKQMGEGACLEIADLSQLPFYCEDAEKPEAVKRLIEQASAADGLVLACPEYNYSLAPALKNALDWLSREPGNVVLEGKSAAIMGAGGGMGTARSQYHLRQSCVYFNVQVLNKPEVFSNAFSECFNAEGDVVEADLARRVGEQMAALVKICRHKKGGCTCAC